MIPNLAYVLALVASAIWFAMAFRYFAYQQETAAKVLIPPSARSSPLFLTTAASIRFLGGMNGAFAVLSLALLALAVSGSALFAAPAERAVLLFVLGLAHFSQFIYNVPILRNGGRQGEAYWPVRTGPMLTIFVVDAVETLVNAGAGLLQFV
ncbi:hypothetical protein FHS78_002774 [Parvibaculum indicum]|uniref:hypothetical protein n=1 Tax=Parvibaculum indicum TaxID=562969 RepID=UPI00141DA1F1|nr:hypothetical protein [Parvibaculum indicum]NIJ42472.1 hypothetical protein [Parvibaculum indicum]